MLPTPAPRTWSKMEPTCARANHPRHSDISTTPDLHARRARPLKERLHETSSARESEGVDGMIAERTIHDRNHPRTIVERANRRLPAPLARAQRLFSHHQGLIRETSTSSPPTSASADGIRSITSPSALPFAPLRQRMSKPSVARALAAVRSLYRYLAQEGVVEQIPQAGLHAQAAQETARVPTIEEMNNVLDARCPSRLVSRARSSALRTALRMRHS